MNYFKDFCEDFNTATMPHEKYYNFPEWEMKEYEKKKAAAAAKGKGGSNLFSDEARHHEQMKSQAEQKRRNEMNVVLGGMNQAKREEMKRQKMMLAEMAMAFKTGDVDKQKRLQKRLEPEEKIAGGTAHPWAK
uniref:Uncharacterized protein n=1 Tax=Proboscia inermis TaxID=420281 RepID=A0A7S0GF31_9STRA|mmetsp:Transcript_27550/g.27932  ORF Transcript_27550/g.27932 Transcript_27550/m.27932 type:complete len:133 (+) Transcript_27550:352-750(+)